MQITVLAPDHLRLDTALGDDGLSVEGEFGPLQMLAASLALCTASVTHTYAETASFDLFGLAVEIRWDYADDPYRVGRYDITLHLPESVPVARHRAIIRAADTCTVHQTLTHSPTIETVVQTFTPDQLAAPHLHAGSHEHEHQA